MTRLMQKRYERGLSISAVALQSGVSRVTISQLEQTGALPQASVAKKLADFYGCAITELWPLEPVPTEPERAA